MRELSLITLVLLFLIIPPCQATYFSDEVADKVPMNDLPRSTIRAIYQAFDRADYFDHKQFEKNRYFWIIDFTLHSSVKRGILVDLKKNRIQRYLVSHGENSDDGQGYASSFSNIVDSYQSSLGLYQAAQTYYGKHGKSLRLEGLEATNDRAFERAIVIHSADYVSQKLVDQMGRIGNSQGCPAVEKKYVKRIIRRLRKKGFIYMFHEKFSL